MDAASRRHTGSRVCLIGGDPVIHLILADFLVESGCGLASFGDVQEYVAWADKPGRAPDVIILELCSHDPVSTEILQLVHQRSPLTPILVLAEGVPGFGSDFAQANQVVACLCKPVQLGAFETSLMGWGEGPESYEEAFSALLEQINRVLEVVTRPAVDGALQLPLPAPACGC